MHVSRLGETFRVASIDFRPAALGSARSESLYPGPLVMRPLQAVDPPKAERLVQRFSIGHGFLARIFFKNAEPNALRVGMILLQPAAECRRRLERPNFQVG